MKRPNSSFLTVRRSGSESAEPWLLLHDRYEGLETAAHLARHAPDLSRLMAVQAPRTQTIGGHGHQHSHYWYNGPVTSPEMSSLGDALFQLEALLRDTIAAAPEKKAGIVGRGEGATVGLLLAMLWPEHISSVVAIDGGLPKNFADVPIEPRPVETLEVVLLGRDPEISKLTADVLIARGAHVKRLQSSPEPGCIHLADRL